MFTKSAAFYDAIYGWKDYAGETQKLDALIRQHKRSTGVTLLDVACGTGAHAPYLRHIYTYEVDDEMLAVARDRYPDLPFHHDNEAAANTGEPGTPYTTGRRRARRAVVHAGTVEQRADSRLSGR